MQNIIPFQYKDNTSIRAVTDENGEPWFVATDIAKILGYRNAPDMTRRLDRDEADTRSMRIRSENGVEQNRDVTIISESGLYAAILGSKLPAAKEFKRWITHEVLPSIRRHGAYMTPQKIEEVLMNPDTIIQLATALKDEQAKTKELTAKVEADAPKVIFADAVSVSKTSILVGQLAKILRQNGVEIGQQRLFKWLRNNGYLCKQRGMNWNTPRQEYVEQGLFEVKETAVNHSDGHVSVSLTTKVTGKGQLYFINKFLHDKAV